MKILLLSKYPRLGASSRLRTLQYIDYLESKGGRVDVRSFFDDGYLSGLYSSGRRSFYNVLKSYISRFFVLFTVYRYDLIWIEKEIFPYFPSVAERFLRFFGKPYVVDYDDAIFHNYDLSGNWLVRKFLGKKIDSVMRHSSCVIAGNDYLAERARVAGSSRVEIIPTVIDLERYEVRDESCSKKTVIGWIGSPSTQKYLLDIAPELVKLCVEYQASMLLVGATPEISSYFSGVYVDVKAWKEEDEVGYIRQMTIGIMPLPDGPWEKGKCGYKIIQYMACGVPVVASPVGVNIEIVENNESGLLAEGSRGWRESLQKLLQSSELRRECGRNGRSSVEKIYSLQVQSRRLHQTFIEVLS
ncbi:glycosyltransferase family 4 protein [Pseudomonas aeruginosa]|uniref:glycosyltransferase family 4 protein n=1 Tax=Pseudomonas aeruginosa TaxID=287 RepID=UPI00070B4DEE|nr:glycosyltransferase family 4 protein [Pseudomonas aeruginosa]NNB78632.1 glycosyltransferase family 4 protein [Pseudomonas aeruginosa]RPS73831.1 glycosyl transferase family 1 [Pseudomonas aeruginosa]RUB37432.1 glycosyltransferase [Pseudomonas aeruginosa]HBN8469016.1 glycosyltransferase family 4 protein [Pseudomonas aeruginosa]HCD6629650.1 glycosyltransferase family 4 protein [Pseudomonas aeruginosa]